MESTVAHWAEGNISSIMLARYLQNMDKGLHKINKDRYQNSFSFLPMYNNTLWPSQTSRVFRSWDSIYLRISSVPGFTILCRVHIWAEGSSACHFIGRHFTFVPNRFLHCLNSRTFYSRMYTVDNIECTSW